MLKETTDGTSVNCIYESRFIIKAGEEGDFGEQILVDLDRFVVFSKGESLQLTVLQ